MSIQRIAGVTPIQLAALTYQKYTKTSTKPPRVVSTPACEITISEVALALNRKLTEQSEALSNQADIKLVRD